MLFKCNCRVFAGDTHQRTSTHRNMTQWMLCKLSPHLVANRPGLCSPVAICTNHCHIFCKGIRKDLYWNRSQEEIQSLESHVYEHLMLFIASQNYQMGSESVVSRQNSSNLDESNSFAKRTLHDEPRTSNIHVWLEFLTAYYVQGI